MDAALQTEPLELLQSDLPNEVLAVMRQFEEAQTGERSGESDRGAPDVALRWQQTEAGVPYLQLDSGVRFVPDGTDGQRGLLNMILGVLGAILGVVMLLEQADTMMVALGCAVAVGGGYLFTRGRRMSKAAKASPRRTGIYLFDDMLVQLTRLGCRRFPRGSIERFEFPEHGPRAKHLELIYQTAAGEIDKLELIRGRDASELLNAWLASAPTKR